MKYFYLLLFTTCCAVAAHAQKPLKGVSAFLHIPGFVEPDGGLAMGVEYRFSKHISVSVEGTWIFLNNDLELHKRAEDNHGFRISPEVKFYIPGRKERYKWFFAVQTMYKEVTSLHDYIVPIYENDEQVYEQLIGYEWRKQAVAFGGRMGVQTNFGGKKERMFFEASLGMGVKYKWGGFLQEPPKGSSRRDGKPWISTDEGWYPDLPFKVRLGYRF